jgi:hypothetical protein
VREDRYYAVSELAGRVAQVDGSCTGIDLEAAVAGAFQVLSRAVSRGLRGAGLRDVRPPLLADGRVYTGQCVGRAVVEVGGALVAVEVRPKLRAFSRIVEEARRILAELGLAPCTVMLEATLAGVPGLDPLGYSLAVRELLDYIHRGQPVRRLGRGVSINTAFYATVAASLAILARTYRRLPAGAAEAVGLTAVLRTPVAMKVLDQLDQVLEEPELDTDQLATLAAMARLARVVAVEGASLKLVQLQPTPRVYELYVLARLARALSAGRVVKAHGYCTYLVAGGARIYYHELPAKASRVVEWLAGRPPDPDIVVEADHGRTVVEAKYRLLNRARLGLADALRLVAYALDLADTGQLKAVVAHPNRYYEDTVRVRVAGASLEVKLVPVHPDTPDGKLREAVLAG